MGGVMSYTPFGFAGGYTDPTGLVYLIRPLLRPGDRAVLERGSPSRPDRTALCLHGG